MGEAPAPAVMTALPLEPMNVIVPPPPTTSVLGPLALMVTLPLPTLTVSFPRVVTEPPAAPSL